MLDDKEEFEEDFHQTEKEMRRKKLQGKNKKKERDELDFGSRPTFDLIKNRNRERQELLDLKRMCR